VTSIFYGEGERCPMSFADIEGEVYCDNIELVEPDIDDETEYHECPECGLEVLASSEFRKRCGGPTPYYQRRKTELSP
jgi:hypothetical protein